MGLDQPDFFALPFFRDGDRGPSSTSPPQMYNSEGDSTQASARAGVRR